MFFRLTHDDLSPALARLLHTAHNPTPVLRAAGTVFKSITEGCFNSAGARFRPIPWKPKADGSPSNLQKSRTLSRSFHLEVTSQYAKLSNPMIYAAIHQFGGKIVAKGKALRWVDSAGVAHFCKSVTIPARPFFPVENGKLSPEASRLILAAAQRVVTAQLEGHSNIAARTGSETIFKPL